MLVRCLLLLGLPVAVLSQTYVSFDGASASSTYSAGAFSADQALSAGSGYWCRLRLHFHFTAMIAYVSVEVALSFNCLFVCLFVDCSSGSHSSGQIVTWAGVLNARRKALGVKLNWFVSLCFLRAVLHVILLRGRMVLASLKFFPAVMVVTSKRLRVGVQHPAVRCRMRRR